ncbi:hypothetical protein A4R35_00805 [Thermogemmatispora tikiterensis]|uniref:Uncharacterized protein n=1 Tax=Thermogemmatispora tikiterensis TaxID=1825093 RepID=A0A328VBC7_9CHLR|nr:hypothetical protein A4R35_00805 [Thermogemmatispora tikiterensis]
MQVAEQFAGDGQNAREQPRDHLPARQAAPPWKRAVLLLPQDEQVGTEDDQERQRGKIPGLRKEEQGAAGVRGVPLPAPGGAPAIGEEQAPHRKPTVAVQPCKICICFSSWLAQPV